ncbi:MAG: hypothetical protein D6757_11110 [Alphaproteobacteria bacterium]|nr:MAG: hypothetical protein D6757_11110 [Alphaproteobacteria bacterium]
MTKSPLKSSTPSQACAPMSPPSVPKPPLERAASPTSLPEDSLRGGRLKVLTLACPDGRGQAMAHLRLPTVGTATRAGLVILPPFGEEGNRARRFLAHLARLLAARGIASLLLDLSGNGESPQTRAPLRIAEWFAEIDSAVKRLAASAEQSVPTAIFGMRHGGMVAAERHRCAPAGGPDQGLILFDVPPEPVGGRLARVRRRLFSDPAGLPPLDDGAHTCLHDPELIHYVSRIPVIPVPSDESDVPDPANPSAVHRLAGSTCAPPVWAQREALVPAELLLALAHRLESILVQEGSAQ